MNKFGNFNVPNFDAHNQQEDFDDWCHLWLSSKKCTIYYAALANKTHSD